MKQNLFYVMFFMLIIVISKSSCLNVKRNDLISKEKQILIQEVAPALTNSLTESKPLNKVVEVVKDPSVTSSPHVHSYRVNTPVVKQAAKRQATVATVTESPETTAVEFTLPELKVDESHSIESYYPYFYKTHILEYQEIIDYKELTNDCLDLGCQWCDNGSKLNCSECRHGFFLFKNKCYTSCPEGYVADIFKKKCVELIQSSKIFIK
jgi:hypothetical protein